MGPLGYIYYALGIPVGPAKILISLLFSSVKLAHHLWNLLLHVLLV